MSRIMLAVFCCALIAGACEQPPEQKKSEQEEPQIFSEERAFQQPVPESEPTIEELRLSRARSLFRVCRNMKFPFHRSTASNDADYPETSSDTDTLLFGERGPVFIVGTIPDTSRYFGIFYLIPGDDLCLSFSATDKSGHIVERKMLVSGGWKGRESDNESFIHISKDLTVTFDYSEYLYDDESEDNWHVPNDANGHITTSKITPSGKIKLLQRTEKDPAKLLEHPILH